MPALKSTAGSAEVTPELQRSNTRLPPEEPAVEARGILSLAGFDASPGAHHHALKAYAG
jgi:hypothetical protein